MVDASDAHNFFDFNFSFNVVDFFRFGAFEMQDKNKESLWAQQS